MKTRNLAGELYYYDPAPENRNPVVLLHGLGSDSSSWLFQVEVLIKEGFRPIAVDVPGFGRSTYPKRYWKVRQAAWMITVELLDKIQTPIDLIGLSMGGTIAQQIVKMRPKMVNNLMLVSTFARLRPSVKKTLPYLSKRFKQMVLGDIRDQANTVADRIFPDENQMEFHEYLIEQIKHANPRVYRQSMIAMAAFNGTPWMRNWQGRTLVVAGSEDSTVTLENQRRLARIIQNGRFEIIPGAGHALTIDHVDQFNLLMIDFLKNSEK